MANTKRIYKNLSNYSTSDDRDLRVMLVPFSVDIAEVIEKALDIGEITPDGAERIIEALLTPVFEKFTRDTDS